MKLVLTQISKEFAHWLLVGGQEVFLLLPDGTETVASTHTSIQNHHEDGGIFAREIKLDLVRK